MPRITAQGLVIPPNVWRSMIPQLTFEPSIAVAAGRIDKYGLDIRSWREPLKRVIKQVVVPSIRKNFDAGGRPPWQALEPTTVIIRARSGYGPTPILVQTGLLKRTATQQNIWTVTDKSAAVLDLPSKIWYGKLHQAGWRQAEFVAPARPFLIMQPEDQEKAARVFEDYLIERWEKAYPGR